jgi:outer membrane protein OmpA-like peptidoglycan-associated protein
MLERVSADVAIDRLISGPGKWVPNLAKGASIWRLAPDLNAPALFEGRLLEPKIAGSENLPSKIEWNVTGLLSIDEARRSHAEDVDAAFADFVTCLERAATLFERAGYEHYREAFSIPAFDADGGAHYFYSPADRALRLINWGASPSRAGAGSDRVIGYVGIVALVAKEKAKHAVARSGVHARKKDRRAWWWLVLIALALAVAVIVALLASDRSEPRDEPDPVVDDTPPEPPPERAPEAPPPIEALPPPIPAPHQRIHFEIAEHDLRPSERESLEAIHAYLVEHPSVRVLLVEGHADFVGEERDNTELSAERATRVMSWLEERGIDRARLRGAGCSELYPIETDTTRSRLGPNRRVEFFVLDPILPDAPVPHAGCTPVAP